MTKFFKAATLFGAALVFVLSAADTVREQTLQKGIDLMESKGDLPNAMPLFEDAARSSDRSVAARALLYLGEAQERQGTEKARATYERIVREFSSQTQTAAAAQKRLSALGAPRSPGALTKRLLCAECGDSEADFSPDGHLMVFTDWDSGDLATRDMSTGQVKRLMAKSGTWKDSGAYGGSPVLSRDLRQIVYLWEVGNKEDDHQLRLMQNEPRDKSRVLIDNPENKYYDPTAWSPDGKSVLVILTKADTTWQLARVSVPDGAVKVLKSLEWRIAKMESRPRFSPDGQYVVYSAWAVNPSKLPPAASDPRDQHIYVLAADGSNETEIVKTAGINKNPVWTPDGKHILFISDRLGKSDLWSIAVQNGKAVSAASLISPEIGNVQAVGMRGGSYLYTNRQTRAEYVNIIEFAPDGKNHDRIARPSESFVGMRPAWSPDGKSLVFKRHHAGSVDDYDLVVHSLETGDERKLLTDLGTSGYNQPFWSHDGKTIFTGIGLGVSKVTHVVDLKTGAFKPMPTQGPAMLSPDDKTCYTARDWKDWDKFPAHIWTMDMGTGQEKEFFTMPEPGPARLLLTRDGRTLVISRQDQKTRTIHFARLNVDGTGYREIYTIAQKDFNDNFDLAKDGSGILLAKRRDDNWQLIRIPIEGGAPESTGVELGATLFPRSMALSPDGSRLAFNTRKAVEDLWSLDNVLSALK